MKRVSLEREYLSCADTAKLLRQALKESFPGVTFSVKSKTYSGGASIRVGWVDGPSSAQVQRVTGIFEGAYFDGMIDYKGSKYHTLDGKPVKFGANFLFEERTLSKVAAEAKLAHLVALYARPDWVTLEGNDQWGYRVAVASNAPSMHLEFERYDATHGIEPKESATLARIKFTGDDGYGAGTVGPDGSGRQTANGYPRSQGAQS